jgi:transmembrane sensor
MHEKQELLLKFSKKQCSPEELRKLFKYLTEDTDADYQGVMDAIWQELQSHPPLDPSVSSDMYAAIQSRLKAEDASRPHDQAFGKGRRIFLFPFLNQAVRTAAVIAGILLSAWLLYTSVLRSDQVVHETAFAATATIELPDHSIVTLNANSTIHYPATWKDGNVREVWLEGEAYFAVAHTADHKGFIVHSEDMDIEVLGTEFNVKNRRGETKVTLSSGVVRLNGSGRAAKVKDVVMSPGEHASLDKHRDLHISKVDVRRFTTWKDHVMIFDHTPVPDIAVMIEETYGLKVVLRDDSVQYVELTGSLPTNDLDGVLGMLKEALELEVIRKRDRIIIGKK